MVDYESIKVESQELLRAVVNEWVGSPLVKEFRVEPAENGAFRMYVPSPLQQRLAFIVGRNRRTNATRTGNPWDGWFNLVSRKLSEVTAWSVGQTIVIAESGGEKAYLIEDDQRILLHLSRPNTGKYVATLDPLKGWVTNVDLAKDVRDWYLANRHLLVNFLL